MAVPVCYLLGLLYQKVVVVRVRTDPDPKQLVCGLDRKCAIVQADARRPELTDLLEVQRRMARIAAEQFVTTVSELLYFCGQCSIAIPEMRRCTMLHRSVQRPACRSANASAASQSNFPAATSASSCRSHSSASNSTNHARKAARSSGDIRRRAASTSSTVLMIGIISRNAASDNQHRPTKPQEQEKKLLRNAATHSVLSPFK